MNSNSNSKIKAYHNLIPKLESLFKAFCERICSEFNISLFNADFILTQSMESDQKQKKTEESTGPNPSEIKEHIGFDEEEKKHELNLDKSELYLIELNYFPSFLE
eukprot:CAMPEP_0170521614 /NCGR_PEP_ID=MMETSP0209-20121228/7000_1 /TAXON_ID=665100 ORGANISM="Litonotus pictus, Strain P1" /NCGR_SAMPLE_ID=MMETSP0209 /ASSEMBLY_ACC=CAM_ASM_000301 /LENGTH=104 /DNA_ID=CAMNT_0010808595 /DNA_START=1624 /DNA_END=1935 /DNA_ORIENTATION=+